MHVIRALSSDAGCKQIVGYKLCLIQDLITCKVGQPEGLLASHILKIAHKLIQAQHLVPVCVQVEVQDGRLHELALLGADQQVLVLGHLLLGPLEALKQYPKLMFRLPPAPSLWHQLLKLLVTVADGAIWVQPAPDLEGVLVVLV